MRPPRAVVATLLFSTAVPACAIEPVEAESPRELSQTELTQLRDELVVTTRDEALERMRHFRPLCDGEGYPLVGNVSNKPPGSTGYQPSLFCTDVRNGE